MTITAGVRLGTTETVLHTMVGETAVLWANFCNTTELNRLVTLYLYKSGGTADVPDIIAEVTVNKRDTFYWSGDEKFVLDDGDVISAKCDLADTISAKVCYRAIPVLV